MISHKSKNGPLAKKFEKVVHYRNSVLVGNWFQERFGTIDRNGIVPGVLSGKSGKTLSAYQEHYKPIAPSVDGFLNWKQNGFKNALKGHRSSLPLWHSDSFLQNMTSTNDVFYSIKPGKDQQQGRLIIKQNLANEDIMQSYGNRTNSGLRRQKWCEQRRAQRSQLLTSTYNDDYQPPKRLSKRRF